MFETPEYRIKDWNVGLKWKKVAIDEYIPPSEDTLFGDRVFPVVAVPTSCTLGQVDTLLFWAKNWSIEEHWHEMKEDGQTPVDLRKGYWVMQLVVKPWYFDHIKEQLKEMDGFFLEKPKSEC